MESYSDSVNYKLLNDAVPMRFFDSSLPSTSAMYEESNAVPVNLESPHDIAGIFDLVILVYVQFEFFIFYLETYTKTALYILIY